MLDAVVQAFGRATEEYREAEAVAASGSTNLDDLIERAIFTNKALAALAEALNLLAVELRQQLQAAVDWEREILPACPGAAGCAWRRGPGQARRSSACGRHPGADGGSAS